MSFYDVITKNISLNLSEVFGKVKSHDIEEALAKEILTQEDFITLLSPMAAQNLEAMARRAQEITLRHFGRTMQLYTPLYLSNYCDNQCVYCGFNHENSFERRKLSLEEVEREAKAIALTGLKHILILTGESHQESPVSYIRDCVRVLKKYFSSISIEIYPLKSDEYALLAQEGVDGLTIYQETYDQEIYSKLHLKGPKINYRFRLEAPERGASAGIRFISIGALLGLADWRRDVFFTGLHAQYLQNSFNDCEIGASIPRIRPHAGGFKAISLVSDENIVQIILALRIFLPRLGLSLSTREDQAFREHIMPLGITRMSAGSSTRVGGHTLNNDEAGQFEISDPRSVDEIMAILNEKGYQPVLKDWTAL